MLTLLLAAALNNLVIPTMTVHFSGGQTVKVSGPGSDPERLKYGETSPWINTGTTYSPRNDAAAVQFCINHAKEYGCVTYLVRPEGHVEELKNDGVDMLLWTPDGRYLIGGGSNTIRLWNLSGGLRTVLPRPPLISPGITYSSSEITRLWLDRGDLCVATSDQLFDVQGQPRGSTITTTRYRLPALRGLTVTNYPVNPAIKEAQCMLVRRSD